jgi:glycosyltransferase involved in cell wall biosynthesis
MTCHAWDIFVESNHPTLPEKISHSSLVRTISKFNVEYLHQFCKSPEERDKIHCNYLGLDLEHIPFREMPEHPIDKLTIVSGGGLVEKKGFSWLIQTAGLLRDEGLEFSIVIVGEGPLRSQIESEIQAAGLDNAITLAGALPNIDFLGLLERADLFILPCARTPGGDMDGIPVVLMEAMAIGTPVITTSISGIPELIEHQVTGYLVPEKNPSEIKKAIQDVIKDDETRTKVISRARKRVEERFDINRNVDELIELYSSHGLLT